MEDAGLLECKHCAGTGTCSTTEDLYSCAACAVAHGLSTTRFLLWDRKYSGLRCGGCNGLIQNELASARINKNIGPSLIVFIFVSLLSITLISICFDRTIIHQVITGWFSIGGAVVGYLWKENKEAYKRERA